MTRWAGVHRPILGISRHHYHDRLGSESFAPNLRASEFDWMRGYGFSALRTWLLVKGDMLELDSAGRPSGLAEVAAGNLQRVIDSARCSVDPIRLLFTLFNFADPAENAQWWQSWLEDPRSRQGLLTAAREVTRILIQPTSLAATLRFGIDLGNEPEGYWEWGRPATLQPAEAKHQVLSFLAELADAVREAARGLIPMTVGQHSPITVFPFRVDYREFHWYSRRLRNGGVTLPPQDLIPPGSVLGEWGLAEGAERTEQGEQAFQSPADSAEMVRVAARNGYSVFFWFNTAFNSPSPLTQEVAQAIQSAARLQSSPQ